MNKKHSIMVVGIILIVIIASLSIIIGCSMPEPVVKSLGPSMVGLIALIAILIAFPQIPMIIPDMMAR
ncbi:MAG: hypothetical protein PHU23_06205 [Dehalococcoidales bacterium]|nr:hypothetical protein [Dehalococcoidales bacterium]